MSLERKIVDQAPPASTAARPDPTSANARQTTAKVAGGALNTKRPEHVKVRGHEIDHLQEKTTGSWSHFYRTTGEIDPGRGAAYTIRTTGDISLSLLKPPAFPAEQKHPTVNRHRVWEVELKIYHAADSNVSWPAGVLWPPVRDVLGELVPGAPPANPRPSGTTDSFWLRYDERTATWWAFLTHEGAIAPDPETPADEATEEPEGPAEPEDGAPGEGERPTAREGTLFALHTNAYSRTEDCGRTWTKHPIATASSLYDFSVLENILLLTGDGRLFRTEHGSGGVDEILAPEVETVQEDGLVNPGFELGNTFGWAVFPEGSAEALATAQPPQRPSSGHYLGRADATPLTTEWRVSQLPPEEARGRAVDLFVDVYKATDAEASVVLTVPRVEVQPFDLTACLVAAGGAGSVGRRWVVPGFATFDGTPGTAEFEVIASSGGSVNLQGGFPNPTSFTVNGWADIRIRRPFSDKPMILTFNDIIDLGERLHKLTPGVEAFLFPGSLIAVSGGGNVFANTLGGIGSDAEGQLSVSLLVPAGMSEFVIRYESNGGAIGMRNTVHPYGVSPLAPNLSAQTVEVDTVGEWTTVEIQDVVFPESGSLITLVGRGDVWFDNVRLSRSRPETPSWTAIARDLDTRQHVAVCRGTLLTVGQDGAEKKQTIPEEVTGNVLAVQSQLVILAGEGKLWRSGSLGREWLSVDTVTPITQIVIGPQTRPDIPPAVQALVDGLGGMSQVTNTILQVTGNGDVQVPVGMPPPPPETIVIMQENGSLVTLDPGMVLTFKQAFTAGAHVSYDARRKVWVVVEPDGSIKTSANLTTWTTQTATAAVMTGSGQRALLPADIGRWFAHFVSGTALAYTDNPSTAMTNTVPLATPITRLMEQK